MFKSFTIFYMNSSIFDNCIYHFLKFCTELILIIFVATRITKMAAPMSCQMSSLFRFSAKYLIKSAGTRYGIYFLFE